MASARVCLASVVVVVVGAMGGEAEGVGGSGVP